MAKSKARKQREKILREGHRNPENNRVTWGAMDPVTRTTPTRFGKLKKLDKKHKKRFDHYYDDNGRPFLIFRLKFT